MFELLFANSLSMASSLVIIVAILVEVTKRVGLPKRLIPLSSLILGIFVSWVASSYVITDLVIFSGIISGAIASGIYDFVKISILGK